MQWPNQFGEVLLNLLRGPVRRHAVKLGTEKSRRVHRRKLGVADLRFEAVWSKQGEKKIKDGERNGDAQFAPPPSLCNPLAPPTPHINARRKLTRAASFTGSSGSSSSASSLPGVVASELSEKGESGEMVHRERMPTMTD